MKKRNSLKAAFLLYICNLLVLACSIPPEKGAIKKAWTESERDLLAAGLEQSLDAVLESVSGLSEEQWYWQADSVTWSVALIIEHLIVHDELFYREARVLSSLPPFPDLPPASLGSDEAVSSYSKITPDNSGKAPAYLEPLGRWCSKPDAIQAYSRIRNALIDFVKSTDANLRAYYTQSGRGPTAYRDLHQLLLISIAHTRRHHQQIKNTLANSGFPKETSE